MTVREIQEFLNHVDERNWQQALETLAEAGVNIGNDARHLISIANNLRKQLSLAVLTGCILVGVLVVVHIALLLGWWILNSPTPLHPPLNALWGITWLMFVFLSAFVFGGWPVQGPFIGMVLWPKHSETDQHDDEYQTNMFESVARVYVGIIVIGCFINMAFDCVPFFGSWDSFVLFLSLPSAIACYFLVRWMGRQPIDWAKWAIVPLLNILLNVACMYYIYIKGKTPDWTDPEFWLFAAVAVAVVAFAWPGHNKLFSLKTAGIFLVVSGVMYFGLGAYISNTRARIWPIESQYNHQLRADRESQARKQLEENQRAYNDGRKTYQQALQNSQTINQSLASDESQLGPNSGPSLSLDSVNLRHISGLQLLTGFAIVGLALFAIKTIRG